MLKSTHKHITKHNNKQIQTLQAFNYELCYVINYVVLTSINISHYQVYQKAYDVMKRNETIVERCVALV